MRFQGYQITIFVGLVFFSLSFFSIIRKTLLNKKANIPTGHQYLAGNKKIESFRQAKKIMRKIYKDKKETLYCGCSYGRNRIKYNKCSYIPELQNERAHRVEWEHIVPVSAFGRSFDVWQKGHSRCVNGNGRRFRGRKCARFVSKKFRLMEADLHNLAPAIGEINQKRSDYEVSIIHGGRGYLGNCQTKILNSQIEPRKEVRGFIARVYLYMHHTYPKYAILVGSKYKMMKSWSSKYPPTKWEKLRNQRIKSNQGNGNPNVF